MKTNLKYLVVGIIIGVFLGYAWHFFAVKNKLEIYRNYEQILKQKDAKIANLEFRSQLCCGYIEYLTRKENKKFEKNNGKKK